MNNIWKFFSPTSEETCFSCYEEITSETPAVNHHSSACQKGFHLACVIPIWAKERLPAQKKWNNKLVRPVEGPLCKRAYNIPDPLFRKIQPLLLWERNKFQYGLLHLIAGSIMAITFSGSFLLLRSKVSSVAVSEITKKALLVLSGLTSSGLSYFTTKTIYYFSLDYFVKD